MGPFALRTLFVLGALAALSACSHDDNGGGPGADTGRGADASDEVVLTTDATSDAADATEDRFRDDREGPDTGIFDGGDAADATDDGIADGGCPAPLVWRYESAGCGDAAHPVCGSAIEDACAIPVCGCNGQSLIKCDYASEPWSTVGACDAGADAADATDEGIDDGGCAAPLVWRYESPGCGDAAHPVCGSAIEEACAIPVCGCNGQSVIKCEFASEPWSAVGACDGGADANGD